MSALVPEQRESRSTESSMREDARIIIVTIAGAALIADRAGALYWPEHGLLAVADLHLEKGSSFAARGAIAAALRHRGDAGAAVASDRALRAARRRRARRQLPRRRRSGAARRTRTAPLCAALQRGRDWIWITGNHDPDPAEEYRRRVSRDAASLVRLTFRHLPTRRRRRDRRPPASGRARSRIAAARSAAAALPPMATRLVMPAFGAYHRRTQCP